MNPTVQEIAQDIYSRAQSKGVDPNFALGLALREGLNKNTVGSTTFGNHDAKGYSYGPWQLYSGSPVAGAVAPGGQAAAFMRQYGQRPNAQNWREQNDFALSLLKRLTPQQQLTTWYAIRDNGGHQAISNIGLKNALSMGLMQNGAGGTTPIAVASAVTPGSEAPQTDVAPPPPPDAEPDAPEMSYAMAGDESIPGYDATDFTDVNQPMMDDTSATDATVGMRDIIGQKAAMGKQRRAELASPLGQLFNEQVVGMAGKQRA